MRYYNIIKVLLITTVLSGCAAERQLFREDPVPVIMTLGVFFLAGSVISSSDL